LTQRTENMDNPSGRFGVWGLREPPCTRENLR
jgi:hypothetical protein